MEQIEYEKKLKEYRAETQRNSNIDMEIIKINGENKIIAEKIQKLESARDKISNQQTEFTEEIKIVEKGPNHDLFQGKNENNYWINEKTDVKNSLYQFLKKIKGDEDSVVKQIDKKFLNYQISKI